jgi:hypothetical protein
MSRHRVEFLNSVEGEPSLVGVFETLDLAQSELRQEWERWESLVSRTDSLHSVSPLNGSCFAVWTASGQSIVYRIERESEHYEVSTRER